MDSVDREHCANWVTLQIYRRASRLQDEADRTLSVLGLPDALIHLARPTLSQRVLSSLQSIKAEEGTVQMTAAIDALQRSCDNIEQLLTQADSPDMHESNVPSLGERFRANALAVASLKAAWEQHRDVLNRYADIDEMFFPVVVPRSPLQWQIIKIRDLLELLPELEDIRREIIHESREAMRVVTRGAGTSSSEEGDPDEEEIEDCLDRLEGFRDRLVNQEEEASTILEAITTAHQALQPLVDEIHFDNMQILRIETACFTYQTLKGAVRLCEEGLQRLAAQAAAPDA